MKLRGSGLESEEWVIFDEVILQQVDKSSALTASSDGNLETRYYYLHNWRHDVCGVITSNGELVEWIKYSAYGKPFGVPAGNGSCNGVWGASDDAVISGWNPLNYDVAYDPNYDGVVDGGDITHANSITGGYQTLGRGVLSSTAIGNRKGYAGYEFNFTLVGAKWDVRHRVLDSDLGRWTRRDPLGYVDGVRLYCYISNSPITHIDPMGTCGSSCKNDPNSLPPRAHQRCVRESDIYPYIAPPELGPAAPLPLHQQAQLNKCRNWCTEHRDAGNDHDYATTFCNDGSLGSWCCICDETIAGHTSDPDGFDAVETCVENHENIHISQHCNIQISENCGECVAYNDSINCLTAALSACTTQHCRDNITYELNWAINKRNEACRACRGGN